MNSDLIGGIFLLFVGIVIVCSSVYVGLSDEYHVNRRTYCVNYDVEYICQITNGEDLFRCKTKEECNILCNKVRNGEKIGDK